MSCFALFKTWDRARYSTDMILLCGPVDFRGFFLVGHGLKTRFHGLLFSCGIFYINLFIKSDSAGFM